MSIFTGKHRQAWAEAFIAGIPYAVASGMTLVETGPGHASLLLPARSTWTGDAERQLIHPGCLSVLADTACGVAVGCALEERVSGFWCGMSMNSTARHSDTNPDFGVAQQALSRYTESGF
ncbi:MAG: hypothetical protein WAP57_03155 [Aquabacterium commune]|uniref:PaaI family thioesterase n=1 Tax=Aquabacterium commune TaxID=70586 RepID=UPI003BAF70E0